MKEKERLEEIADRFSMIDGFNGYMTKYRVDVILRNCPRGSLLDIGSADAFMAEALHPFYDRIVALDGSETLIKRARERLTGVENIEFACSLVENFQTDERFDVVLLSFILEHIENPSAALKRMKKFMKPNGVVFIMVPNAQSLHRRVGKVLGLIPSVDALNETDNRQGHRRVYTLEGLKKDVLAAGLQVRAEGTFFIKPFSNAQMELIDKRIADALFEVSFDIPGLGSMIFIKATT